MKGISKYIQVSYAARHKEDTKYEEKYKVVFFLQLNKCHGNDWTLEKVYKVIKELRYRTSEYDKICTKSWFTSYVDR